MFSVINLEELFRLRELPQNIEELFEDQVHGDEVHRVDLDVITNSSDDEYDEN